MKIAFIHPGYPDAGGTGAMQDASAIVQGLADCGHDVCVYCMAQPPKEFDSELQIRPLNISGFPYHTNTVLNRELRKRAAEFNEFDVLHSYPMSTIPAMAFIGENTTVRTVITLNAYGAVCPKNDLRFLDKTRCRDNRAARCMFCSVVTSPGQKPHGGLYHSFSRLVNLWLIKRGEQLTGKIDAFQAVSSHVRKAYGEFGFPTDRIEVIPNVLDEKFDVEHASGFEAPYRLLYVGWLEKQKGVEKLLPIIKALKKRRRNAEVHLTVVGDGSCRKGLELEVKRENLGRYVEFRGFVPNDQLPQIYASHDLFLYPGEWEEPFGRIFLEALAAGTPVVASRVGGVEGIIGDGGLVTDGTVGDFCRKIEGLLEGDGLLKCSQAGKRQARKYSKERIIPQFEALYKRVSCKRE
jgi:glycosyltransferase involved in cell wall biosynthesis